MVGKKVASPRVISGICLTARTFAQPKSTRKVKSQYDRFITLKLVLAVEISRTRTPLVIETWDRGRNLIKVWLSSCGYVPRQRQLEQGPYPDFRRTVV